MSLRQSRLLWALLMALVVGLMAYAPTNAHPADEGRQEAVFSIQDGKLHWTHNIWLGPLLGLQVWAREIGRAHV